MVFSEKMNDLKTAVKEYEEAHKSKPVICMNRLTLTVLSTEQPDEIEVGALCAKIYDCNIETDEHIPRMEYRLLGNAV